MKRAICSLLVSTIFFLSLAGCGSADIANTDSDRENVTTSVNDVKYNEAMALISEGKLEEAYDIFLELGDFKDAAKQLDNFIYMPIKQISEKVSSAHTDPSFESVEVTLNDKGFPIKILHSNYAGISSTVDIEFNNSGNYLSFCTKRDNYYKLIKYEYNYDQKLVKETVETRIILEKETIESGSTTEYVYDLNDNLINKTTTLTDGLKTSHEYTYTKSGKISNIVYINENGERKTTFEYTYDEKDRLIQSVEHRTPAGFDGDTVENITMNYTYSDKDQESRIEVYYDGKKNSVYEYFYNTDGTIKKEEREFNGSQDSTLEYFYDANGNLIKYTYSYGIGKFKCPPFTIKEYEYDNEGNMIKKTTDQGDNYLETISYTYDDHGNVINRNRVTLSASNGRDTNETEYKLVYIPCFLKDYIKEKFNLFIQ